MPIHPTAVIHPETQIDPTADIGPYAVIDAHTTIGAKTRVGPHVHITGYTTIGENCTIHASAVVGGEPQDTAFDGTVSYCRIGNNVTIREHVTIHRGTGEGTTTIIGDNCYLMADAHVAHNCRLGKGVTLINCIMMAGHVHIDDRVVVGGGAGFHQFVRVGKFAMIAGHGNISKDVPPFALTDRDGHILGVNVVGLRRGDYTSAQRTAIKAAYKLLFRQRIPFTRAVEQLEQGDPDEAVQEILDFIKADSKRGITRGSIKSEHA